MNTQSIKALFVIHRFEVKKLEESAGYIEVARPMIESGYLADHRLLSFGRALDYYQKKVEKRIKSLRIELAGKPVVVYGAGAHTGQFLKALNTLNIVALADRDEKLWGTQRFGYTIISPSEVPSLVGHAVISSRAYESSILIELSERYGGSVNLAGLYVDKADEYYHQITKKAEAEIEKFKPDVVVYTPTHPSENIRSPFFLDLKTKYPNIKIVNMWWDYDEQAEHGSYLDYERDCLLYSDYVIENSNQSRLSKMSKFEPPYQLHTNVEKVHFHPTVFDSSIFYPSDENKEFDVAIWGSSVGERGCWIEFLKHEYGDRFRKVGGVSDKKKILPVSTYARMYRRTKIAVNTQTYPFRTQCKGKVREALCSGLFLLEEENPETRAFIPDGCGISYFSSREELKSKIDYYLDHPIERDKIVKKGQDWRKENNTSKLWTYKIFLNLGLIQKKKEVRNEI